MMCIRTWDMGKNPILQTMNVGTDSGWVKALWGA